MFPRIFFIFFLILSPSIGSESEGPSETECRPYIEKALQREGVTQEPGQTIDDVGEPPQIDDTIDGSKDDATSGEGASGSVENLQDSGGSTLPNVEVAPEEESSGVSEEVLYQGDEPRGVEDALESSGEPLTGDSVESVENTASEELGASDEANATEPLEPQDEESIEGTTEENDTQTAELSTESLEATEVNAEDAIESREVSSTSEPNAEQSSEISIEEAEVSDKQPASVGSEQSKEESDNNSEQSPSAENHESPKDLKQDEKVIEEAREEVLPVESESDAKPIESVSDTVEEPTSTENADSEPVSIEGESTSAEETPVPTEPELTTLAEEEQISAASEPITPSELESTKSNETDDEASSATESAEELPASFEKQSVDDQIQSIEGGISSYASSTNAEEVKQSEATSVGQAEPEATPLVVESAVPKPESDSQTEEEISPASDVQATQSIQETETEPTLPEEELIMPLEIPSNLRTREHMAQILKLEPGADEKEKLLVKTIDNTLRDLKKLYDVAIKPLEILYKYRDLSNRHFGDPEIFSKPLILFMGPWSGGKSTIINYLLENEFKKTALRSGAEPSPAYFNIVMHGETEEILDGTQLAADWTFSGLQKFGQGLLDRLRGLKLNHPLLQKVNIVEIPGILEIRKQVERLFPFNDACQWFIDRADIIFLVYDPSKLDVGPETEAILDQLKGREMQTRIVLNKADQVKPEELMRVQGTLIWNISPLMSSTEPPVMYSTSLWSLPYEVGAPARLLYAQECSFLKDLREAIDKRVENKIASARRFAVRVRNHAKMVDCYLTTYYNHKTFFGNKKKVSDDIIEHPQNYHIYEGLSTLTNISRYDLPDPDVYKDFFRLNPVYEFQQLSATCTYFRGCPINRLDVAIAYDLPDLVGKYKKSVDEVLNSRK